MVPWREHWMVDHSVVRKERTSVEMMAASMVAQMVHQMGCQMVQRSAKLRVVKKVDLWVEL